MSATDVEPDDDYLVTGNTLSWVAVDRIIQDAVDEYAGLPDGDPTTLPEAIRDALSDVANRDDVRPWLTDVGLLAPHARKAR